MKYLSMVLFGVMVGNSALAGSEGTEEDLLKRLPEAKLSLRQGMDQVRYEHGPTISAKFEIKKGILKLSIYTVKKGLGVGAEKNPLLELIGDSTLDRYSPDVIEFEDKPHIARASVQLSLLQLGQYSIKQVMEEVTKAHPGMIYSVKPKLIVGKALVEVKVAQGGLKNKVVYFDLMSGDLMSKSAVSSCDSTCTNGQFEVCQKIAKNITKVEWEWEGELDSASLERVSNSRGCQTVLHYRNGDPEFPVVAVLEPTSGGTQYSGSWTKVLADGVERGGFSLEFDKSFSSAKGHWTLKGNPKKNYYGLGTFGDY